MSLKVILLRYDCTGIVSLVLWDRAQLFESGTMKTYLPRRKLEIAVLEKAVLNP